MSIEHAATFDEANSPTTKTVYERTACTVNKVEL